MSTSASCPLIRLEDVRKSFTLHLQDGVVIPVFEAANLAVQRGECVVLTGASGIGKSTLLKLIYGNYRPLAGRLLLRHDDEEIDLAQASPHRMLALRRRVIGYVSQFLRCVPRVAALDVVAEPLLALGEEQDRARARAAALLTRLRIPERLQALPPATFSGGEQQRVNIARGFIHRYPLLLLDEPTASLDADNRATVVELIGEAKAAGAAVLGVFHDADVREAVADRLVDIEALRAAA
jgi:alpha-D-ribose 1-methylphosphonate 5-triphosphate synthase subunit PhnL